MVTIAEEWLNSCSGCEIALLNLGESLLDLLPQLEFVHIPVLMDNKYYGPLGREKRLHIPKAVVGIVSGGVRNSEHLEVLHAMRAQVDILVALGTCALTGGLPALANFTPVEALTDFAYRQAPSLDSSQNQEGSCTLPNSPNSRGSEGHGLASLLPVCSPLRDHVKVDLSIPGCPPHPDWIGEALLSLLEGRPTRLPYRSVCSVCPAWRDNSGGLKRIPVKRMLEQPVYDPQSPLSQMQCLLEQGFMCLGPVTLAGCGGTQGAPRCITARTPCRGCQGPVSHLALPNADYMAALTAAGVDGATMPDKKGYLSRFHNPIRVLEALREPLVRVKE